MDNTGEQPWYGEVEDHSFRRAMVLLELTFDNPDVLERFWAMVPRWTAGVPGWETIRGDVSPDGF